jgi:hypothetical protein
MNGDERFERELRATLDEAASEPAPQGLGAIAAIAPRPVQPVASGDRLRLRPGGRRGCHRRPHHPDPSRSWPWPGRWVAVARDRPDGEPVTDDLAARCAIVVDGGRQHAPAHSHGHAHGPARPGGVRTDVFIFRLG